MGKEIIVRDEIIINAPKKKVWEIVDNSLLLSKYRPEIKRVEGGKESFGAKHKCYFEEKGKKNEAEERCVIYEKEKRIAWLIEKDTFGISRMFANFVGGFDLESKDSRTTLVISKSSYKPKNIMVKILDVLVMRNKMHKIQQKILYNLKRYVEKK